MTGAGGRTSDVASTLRRAKRLRRDDPLSWEARLRLLSTVRTPDGRDGGAESDGILAEEARALLAALADARDRVGGSSGTSRADNPSFRGMSRNS